MSRPKPLSGFPEYSPEARIIEQFVLDRLRETFEIHGFASIETRAVEPLDRLAKQGEIDKEVYTVQRLHGENGPADLGLHFDLTVPFARYVLENAHQLAQLALRTCGGRSLLKSLPLERLYRDSRCGSVMVPWTAETCLDRIGRESLYEAGEKDD